MIERELKKLYLVLLTAGLLAGRRSNQDFSEGATIAGFTNLAQKYLSSIEVDLKIADMGSGDLNTDEVPF